MSSQNLVLLTRDEEGGRIAARFLSDRFSTLSVVVEQPVSRVTLLRRRARRLGPMTVIGQVAFMLWQRTQRRISNRRIAEIKREFGLADEWPERAPLARVPSVNDPQCVAVLRQLRPAAVLVMGTRLIEAAVLQAVDAPFINYHAGITPKYRGVHGGYWARAQDDLANCGVTIHLVDPGIDTGAVLYQQTISPKHGDNFSTVSYLQLAAALPLMERAARDALSGALASRRVDLPSRLWSHPTIWNYLGTGIRRGVW